MAFGFCSFSVSAQAYNSIYKIQSCLNFEKPDLSLHRCLLK